MVDLHVHRDRADDLLNMARVGVLLEVNAPPEVPGTVVSLDVKLAVLHQDANPSAAL